MKNLSTAYSSRNIRLAPLFFRHGCVATTILSQQRSLSVGFTRFAPKTNLEGRVLSPKDLALTAYYRRGHFLSHATLPDTRRIELSNLGQEHPNFERPYRLRVEHGHPRPSGVGWEVAGTAFEFRFTPLEGSHVQIDLTGRGDLCKEIAQAITYQFPSAEDPPTTAAESTGIDNLTEAERKTDTAPSTAKTMTKRWQPRSQADKWLIQQFFDVHHELRSLATFKDEWLRRRRDEDEYKPAVSDPDDSMGQIIFKERKERKKRDHE